VSRNTESKSASAKTSPDTSGEGSPSLYQNFLTIRESVLRHKWLRSEEAGEDVGFEAALVGWMKDLETSENKD
jgi:hypothetical protein